MTDTSTAYGEAHNPTRMVGRLRRHLRTVGMVLTPPSMVRELLAGALGHEGWHQWNEARASDKRLICLGTFEDAERRLTASLSAAGLLALEAQRAARRTLGLGEAIDPRQTDLLDWLVRVEPDGGDDRGT